MTHTVEGLRTSAGRRLGVEDRSPRLGWRVVGATEHRAWQVQVAEGPDFARVLADTGTVSGSPSWVAWPAQPLVSRQAVHWRVRVETEQGWTPWTADHLEAGLDQGDWVARPIGLADDPGAHAPSPSPRLSTRFHLAAAPVTARLHVTALGLVEASVNGVAVSEDVLAPGWSAYEHHVPYDTYDVTGLLRTGDNELAGVLGDGWWRGGLLWGDRRRRCHYGERTALIAQLEVTLADGTVVVVATDESWTAVTTPVRAADLYDGCDVDLTVLTRPPQPWPVEVVGDGALPVLSVRQGPPVRRTQVRPMVPAAGAPGVLDAGQNLAGWVRLTVRAQEGQRVEVRHAEVLVDGRLATEPLRTARATDTYVLTAGEHVLEPSFTFHGFRFATVQTDAEVLSAEAVVVHSDLARTGHFACSDERLVRLHSNVVWGQLGNFLSVPTDCPQRDERLGWTGDAQVFAATAALLHDCRGFFADWLRDLALEQHADGQVPVVVPDVLSPGEAGIAGWGDAAVVVPWQVALRSGDVALLRACLPSMRAWVDWVLGSMEDGLWLTDKQLGDWLDPDAPPGEPWAAKADRRLVATCVALASVRTLAAASRLLGHDPTRYDAAAGTIAAAVWGRWADEIVTTQAGCALALRSGAVPEQERERVGAALAGLVHANDGRIGTGFLGTPELLFALADTGQYDAAYALLLCQECPSWLYPLRHDATTMWERWDAIGPDGSITVGASDHNDAGMVSFNHYAYGAVASFLHEVVAGLVVRELPEPTLRVAPRPGGGLTWAEARLTTPRGEAFVRWDEGTVTVVVPPGYAASLDLDGAPVPLPAGRSVHPR